MKKVLIIVAVLSLMCAVPAFAGNQNASFTGGDVRSLTVAARIGMPIRATLYKPVGEPCSDTGEYKQAE